MKITKGRKATPQPSTPAATTFEAALAKVGEAVYTAVFAAGSKALLDIEKAALAGKSRRKPGAERKPSAVAKTPTKPVAVAKAKLAPGAKRPPEAIAEVTDRILAFITARPWVTAEQIAAGLKLSTREMKIPLAKLKGLDPARTPARLRWAGAKRATVYALVSELTNAEKSIAALKDAPRPDAVPGTSTEATFAGASSLADALDGSTVVSHASDAVTFSEHATPDVTEPEAPMAEDEPTRTVVEDESAEAAE